MARSVKEWRGKSDDTAIPPRVKLRIFERCGGRCVRCSRHIAGRILPAYDHIIALINGGENRESNIQLLCSDCHLPKSGDDMHIKSKSYRTRLRHVGIKTNKRLIPGSKGSGFRKTMDGKVWKE